MKKVIRKLTLLLIIISLILSVGCTEHATINENNSSTTDDNKLVLESDIGDEKDRIYINDKNVTQWFKTDYKMNNVEDHEAYIIGDTLIISLWFNENVERKEIMTSKDYVMKSLVLSYSPFGAPYGEALNYDYNKVRFTVFIGETPIFQQNFSNLDRGNRISIDYKENLEAELSSRLVSNEGFEKFKRKIKFRYWGVKDIHYQETYKGNVLSVKIEGNKEYNKKDISKIQQMIEKELSPEIDYLGIVLQLYSKDKIYFEKAYHNNNDSERKYWFNEYWGNHNYFDYNN